MYTVLSALCVQWDRRVKKHEEGTGRLFGSKKSFSTLI